MARVRARAVHLHGINTLYHAVSVYTGMHKTLETLETLALRARVSKPVSAVLYIPVYTSTAWYNLYILHHCSQFIPQFCTIDMNPQLNCLPCTLPSFTSSFCAVWHCHHNIHLHFRKNQMMFLAQHTHIAISGT